MKSILFVTGVLLMSPACTTDRRTAQERAKEQEETVTDWRRDRDNFISRMEQQLDEMDRKINATSEKASSHSKEAFNALKERIRKLKADLIESKTSAEGNWEVAKQRMEKAWEALRGDYDRTEQGM